MNPAHAATFSELSSVLLCEWEHVERDAGEAEHMSNAHCASTDNTQKAMMVAYCMLTKANAKVTL